MHLLPGFEFLKIKSVLYDTDNTPKNVTATSQHNAGINKCVKGCNIYFGGAALTDLLSLHISSEGTEEIVN